MHLQSRGGGSVDHTSLDPQHIHIRVHVFVVPIPAKWTREVDLGVLASQPVYSQWQTPVVRDSISRNKVEI